MALDEVRTTPTPAPSTTSAPAPKKSHGGLIGIMIILLVMILLALWGLSGKLSMPTTEGPRELAPGQTLTTAPKGDVVPGFPTELILEEGMTTDASYSIAYADTKSTQPVVTFLSHKTLEQNIAAYKVFFETNGWNIAHAADPDEAPVTFFYAYKNNAEVNVTFASGATGVTVTIAYVIHQ